VLLAIHVCLQIFVLKRWAPTLANQQGNLWMVSNENKAAFQEYKLLTKNSK
jgi:hypothetical protein